MDPPSPSQPMSGTGVQQPQVPSLSTVDDNSDISASSIWRSDGWGPTIWLPPTFATGENPAEIRAEPEGAALLEHHPTPISDNLLQGEATRDTSPGDVPPADNGVASDSKITKVEGPSRVLPKPPRPGFCAKCPDLPSFASRNALRKHKRLVHDPPVPQCPTCRARLSKESLEKHLERVHGITDGTAADSSPTIPAPTHINGTAELLHTSHDAGSLNEAISGRVYCQEHDCGRGFSSKALLESHVRFFHSKQPEQNVEVEGSSSTGVVQRSVEQPPQYCLSTSAATPPLEGGRVTQAENAGTRLETPIEPSPSTQGGVDTQPKTNSLTTNILSLHCRMCDAPPLATTQPTVTTCGHLFCSECITGHVVSTSRCPVCNSSILLYCLFKLDLPVGS